MSLIHLSSTLFLISTTPLSMFHLHHNLQQSWGVCVCWRCKFALLEGFGGVFGSLGGVLKSFGRTLRFWRPFRIWRCTSAWLVLFGGIWKHWICMSAHSNIVSLDLSHWGVFVHIWFIEHLICVGWVHFECLRRHWCKWEPLRAEFCDSRCIGAQLSILGARVCLWECIEANCM